VTAPTVKRATRRLIQEAEAPDLDQAAPVAEAKELRHETVASKVDQAFLRLELQLNEAALEDQVSVLCGKVREDVLPLLKQGASAEVIWTRVNEFAGLYDPDDLNEEQIADLLAEIPIEDGIPFEDSDPGEAFEDDEEEQLLDDPPTQHDDPLILTLAAWEGRDLPEPEWLLGQVVSTTSRSLVEGKTGLGKTNIAIALGLRIAAGNGFLHWSGPGTPRKVLYIDGEMSNRLLLTRLRAEVRRLGFSPAGFHALSAHDVEDFRLLNTAEGQMFLRKIIEQIGGVDFIIFDNVMSVVSGSMIDEVPWGQVLPFARWLTKRNIGQLWIHHTGHDETRSYGTKTREWQMDTVIVLEEEERPETDVSFKLSFSKARERAPHNRQDFRDVEIALVDDQWTLKPEASDGPSDRPGAVSPKAQEILQALSGLINRKNASAVAAVEWKAECVRLRLISTEDERIARSTFDKYRRALKAADAVVIEGDQCSLPR
jgi:AAA domain